METSNRHNHYLPMTYKMVSVLLGVLVLITSVEALPRRDLLTGSSRDLTYRLLPTGIAKPSAGGLQNDPTSVVNPRVKGVNEEKSSILAFSDFQSQNSEISLRSKPQDRYFDTEGAYILLSSTARSTDSKMSKLNPQIQHIEPEAHNKTQLSTTQEDQRQINYSSEAGEEMTHVTTRSGDMTDASGDAAVQLSGPGGNIHASRSEEGMEDGDLTLAQMREILRNEQMKMRKVSCLLFCSV